MTHEMIQEQIDHDKHENHKNADKMKIISFTN